MSSVPTTSTTTFASATAATAVPVRVQLLFDSLRLLELVEPGRPADFATSVLASGTEPSASFRSLCARMAASIDGNTILLDTGARFFADTQALLVSLGYPVDLPADLGADQDKCAVLEFLCTELQARAVVESRRAQCPVAPDRQSPSELIAAIANAAGLSDPAPADGGAATADSAAIFRQITEQLRQWLTEIPADARAQSLTPVLRRANYTDDQLRSLDQFNDALRAQFEHRRAMLLKRVDVTLQSFLWSPKAAEHTEAIAEIVARLRRPLSARTQIQLNDAFLASRAVLRVQVVSRPLASPLVTGRSSASTATGAGNQPPLSAAAGHALKSLVLTGPVPDRGGRPGESRVKKSGAMPKFRKREGAPHQAQSSTPPGKKPSLGPSASSSSTTTSAATTSSSAGNGNQSSQGGRGKQSGGGSGQGQGGGRGGKSGKRNKKGRR